MKNTKKEEIAMRMHVPKDATNGEVADKLFDVFIYLFKNKAKAIAVKMLPEESSLYIKPFSFFKAKVLSNFFSISSELKEEFRAEKFESFSFMYSDTLVEIWNKFMPMEFVFKYEGNMMEMMWDEGMSGKQIKAYWFRNDRDGYNVNGNFWSREWLKTEHKEKADGGGKI